ncbi:MAG: GTPase HflX [Clostridia bacterium]|nr:GTPase HflX [Clostridia bacterium]
MIYGNVEGIKRNTLDRLRDLEGDYDRTFFIDREALNVVVDISSKINREISVFISRGGRLLAIGIGSNATVPLADVSKKRGNKKLNGVRVIHTHPGGNYHLSDVDISALKINRYDCMSAIGVKEGRVTGLSAAYLAKSGVNVINFAGENFDDGKLLDAIIASEQESKKESGEETVNNRAILVHVSQDADAETSLEELASLARTMGYDPVYRLIQKREKADSVTYVGSGKVEEIALICQVEDVKTVICDHGLNGIQFKNLSDALGLRILDRSTLILDIFDRHATTNEGKLQVELARLSYELPMLVGQNVGMSRQRGGLYAMGGSGESKLETDRRVIRKRIADLKEKLEVVERNRDSRREQRRRNGVKNVSIVGYTNAGKSTLMNYITKAGVLEEDKLFATLDSVSRSVWDDGKQYLLTDTVGFIKRLPHEFIRAFKSTLDEARYADLLLVVVDVTSPKLLDEYDVVCGVLKDVGADGIPRIVVYNKCDGFDYGKVLLPQVMGSVYISAKTGEGVDELKKKIKEILFQ